MKTARMTNMEDVLGRVGGRIDRLIGSVAGGESSAGLRADISREFKRISHDVAAARAQVSEDLATTRKDLLEAFRDEFDVWKARVQDLKVQVELGRMELHDRLLPAVEKAEMSIERVGKEIDSFVQSPNVDEAGIDRSLRSAMKGLRHDIETAEELQGGTL